MSDVAAPSAFRILVLANGWARYGGGDWMLANFVDWPSPVNDSVFQ